MALRTATRARSARRADATTASTQTLRAAQLVHEGIALGAQLRRGGLVAGDVGCVEFGVEFTESTSVGRHGVGVEDLAQVGLDERRTRMTGDRIREGEGRHVCGGSLDERPEVVQPLQIGERERRALVTHAPAAGALPPHGDGARRRPQDPWRRTVKAPLPPAGADKPVCPFGGMAPLVGVAVAERARGPVERVVDHAVERHRAGVEHAAAGVWLEDGRPLAGDVEEPDCPRPRRRRGWQPGESRRRGRCPRPRVPPAG